jgi:hypothetical protein
MLLIFSIISRLFALDDKEKNINFPLTDVDLVFRPMITFSGEN